MSGNISERYDSKRSLKFFYTMCLSDMVFLMLASRFIQVPLPATNSISSNIYFKVSRVFSAEPVNISERPSV